MDLAFIPRELWGRVKSPAAAMECLDAACAPEVSLDLGCLPYSCLWRSAFAAKPLVKIEYSDVLFANTPGPIDFLGARPMEVPGVEVGKWLCRRVLGGCAAALAGGAIVSALGPT